ncbi:MAG: non-homologous end-joining DNA ligase [Patescibacteria group bacterium]|nr:non-homologous end-joining DNA ligase [Patescibacteria group bacterium]
MGDEPRAVENGEKIFFPKEKLTKGDVAAYYESVAPTLIPYLAGRPMSTNRFPNGVNGVHFFQKNLKREDTPASVDTLILKAKTTGRHVRYALVNDTTTLRYLVNLGAIELHPWNSRKGSLARPDFVIFDLDPGPKSSFADTVKVARALHRALDESDTPNFCKTSGKRGLHVYAVPERVASYEDARAFARAVAEELVEELPDIASVEHWPQKRRDKVFIDTSRNAMGQTVVAPYSVRPTPEATVSMPLSWGEVNSKLDPSAFTLRTVPERLAKKGDLWKTFRAK